MHLSHPTKSLVRDLQMSQRLERRKAQTDPNAAAPAGPTDGAAAAGGDLGWVPQDAGWVPPSHADDYGETEGDSWRPSKRR
jgi:hypothetical protein